MNIVDYKDFLLNAFIILLPLLLFQYADGMKNKKPDLYPVAMFLLFLIPLILTMSFPIKTATVHDLRAIPLAIGSLYGGIQTAVMLFISLVVYRGILDDDVNLFNYAISLLPTLIVIWAVVKPFPTQRLRNKIAIVIGIILMIRTTVIVIYYYLENNAFVNILESSLSIILPQSVLAGLLIYILEAIRKNNHLIDEVHKAEKMKIVSEIAASVAHEVRNPLTAVRGFIQLLAQSDLATDKRKQYSHICLEELDRAQNIISDYLTLAKPEHEKQNYFSVSDEFTYIKSILSSYANYQNVQIDSQIDCEAMLHGNQSKFRQAIINLGKNAVEAMPDGGSLILQCHKIKENIVIHIKDTGMGMSAEQLDRLGSPYYSTKEKGTGLGTMISYNIINKMGGKIEASSVIGIGTVFKIILPVASGNI